MRDGAPWSGRLGSETAVAHALHALVATSPVVGDALSVNAPARPRAPENQRQEQADGADRDQEQTQAGAHHVLLYQLSRCEVGEARSTLPADRAGKGPYGQVGRRG